MLYVEVPRDCGGHVDQAHDHHLPGGQAGLLDATCLAHLTMGASISLVADALATHMGADL
jgi:hypothetical protein